MTEREIEVQVKSLVTGETVHFKIDATATVKATWDKAYEELNEQPRQGETFRCANGTDLSNRLDTTLEQLRQEGICPGEHFQIRGLRGARRLVPDHPLPTATTPAVARAAVLAHREAAMEGLAWEEESALVTHVTIPALRADGVVDHYLARFSFVYYPDWPPSVTFVNPATRAYDPEYWPKINNSERMALHPDYGDAPAGLICNSMFFEFYFWGGHARQAGQCWEKGRHTMAATVTELQIHLAQPYYIGPNR